MNFEGAEVAYVPVFENLQGWWCEQAWRFPDRTAAEAFCRDCIVSPPRERKNRTYLIGRTGRWKIEWTGQPANCRYEPRNGRRGQVVWIEARGD